MKFNVVDYHDKPLVGWSGETKIFSTEDMVEEVCAPDPYSNYGSIETLEARVHRAQSLIAALIELSSTPEQAAELFSSLLFDKVVAAKEA